MRPTFELRYWDGKPATKSKIAPSSKRNCEPAELITQAKKIFDTSDTPFIEAWLYDHYMFSVDRGAFDNNQV
ncbi:MAG TPA: hypothetical protein VMU59_03640 [Caulobacteraceae bacterium]|nr:hypothetical protein [Caulobacteraceae bacterium]